MKRIFTAAVTAIALTFGVVACDGTPTHHQGAKVTQTQPSGGPSYRSPTFGLPPVGGTLAPPGPVGAAQQRTVLMLDSVDSASVFAGLNPQVVAGYLHPSSWPTYYEYAGSGQFKRVVAVAVRDYVFGQKGAAITCLDVEPGDATPSEAGPWLAKEAQLGFKPCAYSSLSQWGAINASIASSHVPGHVYRWCAEWTYQYHLTPGCDATQWTDHYDNRNIDGSAVTLAFANLLAPKPTTPRCYHKGWPAPASAKALCNRVRKHDSYLGKVIANEKKYLQVSQANEATLQVQVTPLQKRLDVVKSRAAQELQAQHFNQLAVSAANGAKVAAKLSPLQKKLTAVQARTKVEQSKLDQASTQLQADLHKYHWF